jgi:hypothetical protein
MESGGFGILNFIYTRVVSPEAAYFANHGRLKVVLGAPKLLRIPSNSVD